MLAASYRVVESAHGIFDINDNNQYLVAHDGEHPGSIRNIFDPNGDVQYLEPLPGFPLTEYFYYLRQLNNRGEVLGQIQLDGNYPEAHKLVYWNEDGVPFDVSDSPLFGNGVSDQAESVELLSFNNHGEILIYASTTNGTSSGGDDEFAYYIWEGGDWNEIQRRNDFRGYTFLAINDRGQLTGRGKDPNGAASDPDKAIIWTEAGVEFLDHLNSENRGKGLLINNESMVLGNIDVPGWVGYCGGDLTLWNNGSINLIPEIDPAGHSDCNNQGIRTLDFNPSGQVIGMAKTWDNSGLQGGVIWDYQNGTREIIDLLPPDNPFGYNWNIETKRINADGIMSIYSSPYGTFFDYGTHFLIPVNNPPTLDPIEDFRILIPSEEQTVPLAGISGGGSGTQAVRITATSQNTSLIPHPAVDYQSPNTTGSLRFTPNQGLYGSAEIVVTVEDPGDDNDFNTTDDNLSHSETFTVTVIEAHDLGLIEYSELEEIHVPGEIWFYGTSKRDGLLTGQALTSSDKELRIELYDTNLDFVTSGRAITNGARVDAEISGDQRYYFRVLADEVTVDLTAVNLVSTTGSSVNAWGTAAADSFTFAAAAMHRLVINEVDYRFDSEDYNEFTIDGVAGKDDLWAGGTSLAEQTTIRPGELSVTSTNYSARLLRMETMTFVGRGGNDSATFHDTIASEVFTSDPAWSKLEGSGFYHMVRGVPTITALATFGYDVAFMRDSTGDDTYETYPDRVIMASDTHTATAIGFKRTSGIAADGQDTVMAHDSEGDDRLLGYHDRIIMLDGLHTHASLHFETNRIYSSGQAGDVAYLFDSDGDDQVVMRPESASVTRGDRQMVAHGFSQTYAYASAGYDTIEYHDTAGENAYNGYLDRAVMKGDGVFLWGRGFDQMTGHFSTGTDRALMFDSEGDDTYVFEPGQATMSNSDASNRVIGAGSVFAFSDAGSDTAALYDTGGEETFRAYPDRAILLGDDLFSWVGRFAVVTGHSSGGTDIAYLYDSEGDDTFRSEGGSSQMTGNGFLNRAVGFLTNYGYSDNGNDTALMYDTTGNDLYRTYPTEVVMTGQGITNVAYRFEQTHGYSTAGNDSARLFDSSQDDVLLSYADRATLSGNGWSNEVNQFANNTVYGSGGFDQATMEDSAGDDTIKTRAIGPRLVQKDGTVFDVRTFDRILARSVNGGEDVAELFDVDYEFELEGDWNS